MSFSLTLSDCAKALQATLQGEDLTVSGVSIDTRTLAPGELYVAIQGEQFNGHDFVDAAQQAGAAALLVHEPVESEIPQLQVEDTRLAIGQLAKFWARRFTIPTIAITGSNGKTTVKEITATILGQLGPVLATQGNLNNELGVPLTLLRMRKEHLYAVIEMGANHAGEISRLVEIAEPDVALVNNVGCAHLEGFGSIEGVAAAKSEIYAGLSGNGYAIINADDEFAEYMRAAASHCSTREFGIKAEVQVQGVPGERPGILTMDAAFSPRFQLAGEHNLMNALAAVAIVQCLDVNMHDVVLGLERVSAVPGRLEKKPGINGSVIIDDSYNANPDSTVSAMKVLSGYAGKRYLVLGDMAELGPDAEELHLSIGEMIKTFELDGLWTVGSLASNVRKAFVRVSASDGPQENPDQNPDENPDAEDTASAGAHFVDQEALISDLRTHLGADVTVLVKGSRSAHMERVVKGLLSDPGSAQAQSSTPESGS